MAVLLVLAFVLAFATAQSFTQAEIDAILLKHNLPRREYGSPDLVWDASIAQTAQNYANKCIWGHSASTDRPGLGENLAATMANTAKQIQWPTVDGWVGERKDWTCDMSRSDRCTTGAVCGHWTQVVWKSTTKIGCAHVNCTNANGKSPGGYPFWGNLVCNYGPAGNMNMASTAATPTCNTSPQAPVSPPPVVTAPPTKAPTKAPVAPTPTNAPTKAPTNAPTVAGTPKPPTKAPTRSPTSAPTKAPVAPVSPPPKSGGPNWSKCVADSGATHLNYRYWSGSSAEQTPSGCQTFCKGKSSTFIYYGLQKDASWKYCVCYSAAPNGAQVADSNCGGTCASGVQYCGSKDFLAVYA